MSGAVSPLAQLDPAVVAALVGQRQREQETMQLQQELAQQLLQLAPAPSPIARLPEAKQPQQQGIRYETERAAAQSQQAQLLEFFENDSDRKEKVSAVLGTELILRIYAGRGVKEEIK